MGYSLNLIILFFLLSLWLSCCHSAPKHNDDSKGATPPLVLVVAYDGLRYDYVTPGKMPKLHQIALNGVWAKEGMISQFITNTMVNFYSISTGLYPESHGIVSNTFYDADGHKFDYFNFGGNDSVLKESLLGKWYSGQPLWQINEDTGPNYRSGCMFWPACDATIHERLPTFYTHFGNVYGNVSTWTKDLENVLTWFQHPETPINLGFLYISEPDETQHYNNLDGPVVQQKISEIDRFSELLMERVEKSNILKDRLNVIFLSDHGHVNVHYPKNFIDLSNYISREIYDLLQSNGYSYFAKDPKLDLHGLYQQLKAAKENDGLKLKVWMKNEIPDRYHWRDNPLIGPLSIVPDLAYMLIYNISTWNQNRTEFGTHGYSNDYRKMRATFIATGPAFKSGYQLNQPVNNLEVYTLVAKMLGATPGPNNATKFHLLHDALNGGVKQIFVTWNVLLAAAVLFQSQFE